MADIRYMYTNNPVGTFWVNKREGDNLCIFYKNLRADILQRVYRSNNTECALLALAGMGRNWRPQILNLNYFQYLAHPEWQGYYEKHKEFFQEAIEWLMKQHT